MKLNKGDWVGYMCNPFNRAALQIAADERSVPANVRRDAAALLKQGIVVDVEGDQVLVLHAGHDRPFLHDRRDLERIEVENEKT